MGKASRTKNKIKKLDPVLPDGATWANEEHTHYWIGMRCGFCEQRVDFKYDENNRLTDPKYWHLFDDGGRIPYCGADHASAHHHQGYKLTSRKP